MNQGYDEYSVSQSLPKVAGQNSFKETVCYHNKQRNQYWHFWQISETFRRHHLMLGLLGLAFIS